MTTRRKDSSDDEEVLATVDGAVVAVVAGVGSDLGVVEAVGLTALHCLALSTSHWRAFGV